MKEKVLTTVGKSYEFPVIYGVFTKTSYRYAHAMFEVYILCNLRTVILFQILEYEKIYRILA